MPNSEWGGAAGCRIDGLYGPWIMIKPERLIEAGERVGNGQCVAIAQGLLQMPHTSHWREGEKVLGNNQIAKGTIIATFIDGRYKSLEHGNHVAIYIQHSGNWLQVIDQWTYKGKDKLPNYRTIFIKPGMEDRSNNASAFSIVYTKP